MKTLSRSILASLILLASCGYSQADWNWTTDLVEATPTDKGYRVDISFENNGADKISVTGLSFSCPCTVFTYTSTIAKPGETGKITILIAAEKPHYYKDLDVIATGPASCKPKELTIRLPGNWKNE